MLKVLATPVAYITQLHTVQFKGVYYESAYVVVILHSKHPH